MCDDISPARAYSPANDNPQGSSYHAGFRSPTSLGAGASSAIPVITGWTRNIRWSEFDERSARPAGESEDAYIEYSMDLNYGWTTDAGRTLLSSIDILIEVTSASWVVGSERSDELLAHEQGHFDVAGLVYRQMGKDLSDLRAGSERALKSRVARIKREANRRALQLNRRYDSDTDHGTLDVRQQAWENLIRDCINSNTPLTGPPA